MSPSRPLTLRRRAAQRGMSLIEVMCALAIVLVGLLGFFGLQVVTSKTNTFSRRMAQATAIASDFAENVKRWNYTDTRLTPASLTTVQALNTPAIEAGWDLGRKSTPSPKPQFDDTNLGTGYQGLPVDVDGDGKADYFRYWNVYAVDLGGQAGGNASGKLVQIIVRWEEGGTGFRQVTAMAFKNDPNFIFQ